MKVKSLDGRISHWKITGYLIKNNDSRNRSQHHLRARQFLIDNFRSYEILEEVAIKPRLKTQYLDFYLPKLKLAVEVHGKQHYDYIPFFHKSLPGFVKHKERDMQKLEWCKLNNINLLELPYNESNEQWRARLNRY